MVILGEQTLSATNSAVAASLFTIPAGASHVVLHSTDGKLLLTLEVDAILKSIAPFFVGTNATVLVTYLGPHLPGDYLADPGNKDKSISDPFIAAMQQGRTATTVGKTVAAPSPVTNQSPRL